MADQQKDDPNAIPARRPGFFGAVQGQVGAGSGPGNSPAVPTAPTPNASQFLGINRSTPSNRSPLDGITLEEMNEGMKLAEMFYFYLSVAYGWACPAWNDRPEILRRGWVELAKLVTASQKDPEFIAAVAKANDNLLRDLQQYGRHKSTCYTGTECTCGFDKVETMLKQIGGTK